MKNLRKLAALAGILSLAVSFSHAQVAASGAGTHIYEIGVSTPATTVLWLAGGAGNLNAVSIESGTAGGFLTFFDSSTAGGAYTAASDGNAAAPHLATVWFLTAQTPTQMIGGGRGFANGLKVVVGPSVMRASLNISN